MLQRLEIYQLIGRALSRRLPNTDEAEIGRDSNKLYFRMRSQVFAVTVEEREQLKRVRDPEAAAKDFMGALPYPWPRDDAAPDDV